LPLDTLRLSTSHGSGFFLMHGVCPKKRWTWFAPCSFKSNAVV
jgi:hypothetical protein